MYKRQADNWFKFFDYEFIAGRPFTQEAVSYTHLRPSLWMAKEVFYPLKTPEAVCVTYEAGEVLVSTPGADEEVNTPLLSLIHI